MILYDIIGFTPTNFSIKKESTPNDQHSEVIRSSMLSNTNITQDNTDVNNNSMQKHEKDVLYQQRKNTQPDIDRTDVVFADDGVSYSANEAKITPNMDEDKRAEVLRNTEVNVAHYSGTHNLSESDIEPLKKTATRNAVKVLKTLGEKFGLYKNYTNGNVSLEFDYSRSTLKESVNKQAHMFTGFSNFAKMLYVFDDVVKNAVPIEVHTDKYAGTKRANQNLKYDYVLVSAFTDGKFLIPVELHIKEFTERTSNKLYVTITLGKIKMEDNVTTAGSEKKYLQKQHRSVIFQN